MFRIMDLKKYFLEYIVNFFAKWYNVLQIGWIDWRNSNMATSSDYVEFLCEQLGSLWAVRSRKMFGEYMVYVNDKPILLVCDNTVFVKIIPELAPLIGGAARGLPYSGAKEHYILDIEDKDILRAAVEILEPVTPLPKARKKK